VTIVRPRSSSSDPRSSATIPTSAATLLGQVFTPPPIAQKMADALLQGRQAESVSILDPAVGPGTFPRAMRELGVLKPTDRVLARDIDPAMIAACLSDSPPANWQIAVGDYIEEDFAASFDYAILNPPWVRQEWIAKKVEYRKQLWERYGETSPGTSNLYVYFMVRVVHDLKPGGKFVAIVYDSWKSTRYGEWLMKFLERHCDELHWEPASPQPFDGRLIDATIVIGRRAVKGRLAAAAGATEALSAGFTRLGDLAETRRGLRLKQASFFLAKTPIPGATPFVKKIGRVEGYSLPSSHPEWALLAHSLGADVPAVLEIRKRLTLALQDPIHNQSVLTWYRERPDTWFVHRVPPRAPILFNYYLRNAPRHILSDGRAYADNFYGVTPHHEYPVLAAFAVLNSRQVSLALVGNARNQGNGLLKLQLFEYRKVVIPDWRRFPPSVVIELTALGAELAASVTPQVVLVRINDVIDGALRDITSQTLEAVRPMSAIAELA